MAGYGEFAEVYDLLTENVPYDEIAEYTTDLLSPWERPACCCLIWAAARVISR